MPEKYPLEQVLSVKKGRVDKAEKVVAAKKQILETEETKLKKIKKERDVVLHHHDAKLAQLRHALDTGTTSDEVLQMKAYLKTVKEKLIKEEAKVKAQQQVVNNAQKQLDDAKEELRKRRVEEEKIKLHKEHWVKEMKIEHAKKEAIEQDEMGQIFYEAKKKINKETSE